MKKLEEGQRRKEVLGAYSSIPTNYFMKFRESAKPLPFFFVSSCAISLCLSLSLSLCLSRSIPRSPFLLSVCVVPLSFVVLCVYLCLPLCHSLSVSNPL